ncbi:MAG: pyridoxamine 5'-phosphate oxidase [Bacteroidia bacterium]
MKNDNPVHSVGQLRMEYEHGTLLESDLPMEPLELFDQWMREAINSGQTEPHAMHLSTIDVDGMPAGRIVLLRGYDVRGLTFYTNYSSDKGQQLEANPRAAATFFWPQSERQIRVTGFVTRVDAAESDAYFQSRPRESRLGAWASAQSQVLPGREALESSMEAMRMRYPSPLDIPRPPQWGGYRIKPIQYEFWQGRRSRLHDRLKYSTNDAGAWTITRLSP